MTTKNTEFLRAITGPKIEYNGSPVTRYSTWSIGGGLKVDENPFFNKLNLSVDDQHIIDLIDIHGGDSSDWAMYPAVQNVDMDGNSITNLAEPVLPSDAATKEYVDGVVPDRIKGGAGTTYEETQLGVGPDGTGYFSRLLSGVNRGDVFLEQYARENNSGRGHIGWRNTRSGYGRGYVEWSSSHAEIYGGHSVGNYGKVYVDGINGGNVYFDIPGASAGGGYEVSKGLRLGSHISHTPNIRSLPSGVNSILHGIKLGVDAHDALANYEWSEYPAVQNVDMDGNKITNMAEPVLPSDAATKAYVDANSGGGGGGLTIAEGELTLSRDAANTTENVTNSVAQNVRFTRIGDTVTLSGDIYIDVDSAGSATAAFTGLTGAAEPLSLTLFMAIPPYTGELDMRRLRINLFSPGDIRFTVITAEARNYRTHFVITYRGAAL